MRRKNFSTFLKEKAFLILLLVSILSVAGIVAVNMTKEDKDNNPNLLAELEETTEESAAQEETKQVANAETTEDGQMDVAMGETVPIGDAVLAEGETASIMDTSNLMDATDEPTTSNLENYAQIEDETEAVGGPAINLSFTEESVMVWPVEGNVILDFSMDSTVYFSTLKQYKYNPAIVIQGEVNTPVRAAADGVVTEISSNEEIGDFVVMALGNDYTVQYGQLKALEVSMGETVEEGQIIGYISEPTKYYVTEGSNLYMKLMKGDTAMDPLDYIK